MRFESIIGTSKLCFFKKHLFFFMSKIFGFGLFLYKFDVHAIGLTENFGLFFGDLASLLSVFRKL